MKDVGYWTMNNEHRRVHIYSWLSHKKHQTTTKLFNSMCSQKQQNSQQQSVSTHYRGLSLHLDMDLSKIPTGFLTNQNDICHSWFQLNSVFLLRYPVWTRFFLRHPVCDFQPSKFLRWGWGPPPKKQSAWPESDLAKLFHSQCLTPPNKFEPLRASDFW